MEAPEDKEPVAAGSGDVYFVLERATLETAKVGKARAFARCRLYEKRLTLPSAARGCSPQEYHILNCDDHSSFLRKHKRDPAEYRPDILHQARGARRGWQPPPLAQLTDGTRADAGTARHPR